MAVFMVSVVSEGVVLVTRSPVFQVPIWRGSVVGVVSKVDVLRDC